MVFAGTGQFKRNRATHRTHAEVSSRRMLEKCSSAIINHFSEVWDSLPDEFDEGTDPVLDQLQEVFQDIMANCTKEDHKTDEERTRGHLEIQTKQSITGLFKRLMKAWTTSLEEEEEVERTLEHYDMPEDPTNIDDSGDEDYSDGSGIEDESDGY
jgi:hypothetical protein